MNYVSKYPIPAMDYQFPSIKDHSISSLASKSKKPAGMEALTSVRPSKKKIKVDFPQSTRNLSSHVSFGSNTKMVSTLQMKHGSLPVNQAYPYFQNQ